ncbi:MAG: 16S rRNA (cytidine(1402)-2'-O)-methyltransferase [Eubacteriales bacterium]|jgi:16S rRNA (cytidine1402-2'-O)-methyltransferase
MSALSQPPEKNRVEKNTLYLVATPIGNLSDISERALKVLSQVDFIAAEDTRVTLKLLTHFGIKKPLISYYEHNKRERGELIAERILSGQSCALVTDAGTPAISDPGEDLVALCEEKNIRVVPIPGANAAICALAASGLPSGRFCFEGFLPTNRAERQARLDSLQTETRTMIFYEAPHKLITTLSDLARTFGTERRVAVCHELTKINERILRTTLGEAAEYYTTNPPRGEYVLVVAGAEAAASGNEFWRGMSVGEHVGYYIEAGLTKMEAIKAVAADRGVPKNAIYKEIIRPQ